ncbi:hypothetical protein GCM10010977_31060 [Citricoccus zhacaiensis]|uniref:PE-PPE domain-containing protein n=2 Tax=Citricoccus zhacaiensis TaxID=489142 RepID=A0ABQ2MCH2_9MICC|nr:hypothetical protein GCM10010977_31060 [Citricoccus zhacaiensis]
MAAAAPGTMTAIVPVGVGRPGLMDGFPGRTEGGRGEAPASFSVHGGPTSIHANLDDLERGSLLLAAATDEAAALSMRAAGAGSLLALAAAQTGAGRALAARTAILSSGLLSISAEADVLNLGVRSSAEAYRNAEAAAQRAVIELAGGAAFVSAAVLALSNHPIPQPITELAIQAAPEVIAGLLGTLSLGLGVGFRVASDVAGYAARDEGATGALSGPEQLYPLATALGRAAGIVQIGPVRTKEKVPPADEWKETWTPEGEGSISTVMSHLDLAREAAPGSVQITRITPEGAGTPETVWLVSLPGTQTGDFHDANGWSTNPWDMGGNAEALALDSQHVSAAVDEALRAAGAGQDDALVLTGYSQGGLHAARIAADVRIAEHYDVQGLLTIGSPTGEISVPASVEAAHLEHDHDVPAAADGRANPQAANRTTITVSGYDESLYPEGKGVMSGHSFENYAFHAALLDRNPDVARQVPALEHIAALTVGGGVTRSVQLERIRPGNPRSPLGAGASSSSGPGSGGDGGSNRQGRRALPPAPLQLILP